MNPQLTLPPMAPLSWCLGQETKQERGGGGEWTLFWPLLRCCLANTNCPARTCLFLAWARRWPQKSTIIIQRTESWEIYLDFKIQNIKILYIPFISISTQVFTVEFGTKFLLSASKIRNYKKLKLIYKPHF